VFGCVPGDPFIAAVVAGLADSVAWRGGPVGRGTSRPARSYSLAHRSSMRHWGSGCQPSSGRSSSTLTTRPSRTGRGKGFHRRTPCTTGPRLGTLRNRRHLNRPQP
jgi:hypothetical protein